MTEQAFQILKSIFGMIWQLFTGWTIPGTTFTPAVMVIGIFAFGMVLRTIKYLVSGSTEFKDVPTVSGRAPRGGGKK